MYILLASKICTWKRAFTLLELMVVVIIIAILATIGYVSWQAQLEKRRADNAQIILRAACHAEQIFYSWQNKYTDNWDALDISNPNNIDPYYTYTISGTPSSLTITAQRKGKTEGFCIDSECTILGFQANLPPKSF